MYYNPKIYFIYKFSRYFKAINDPNDRFFQADDDIIYFNEHIAQKELEILFNELDLPFTEDDIKRGLTSLHNGKAMPNRNSVKRPRARRF